MAIRLFDSLTREVRELKASQPDGVFRMYCCGPTVYGPAHIGNFRTFIVQDVLRRVLELEFGPDKVRHVRNLTDVDDRTIGQAGKEQRPLGEITKKWTDIFHEDCKALNLLPPHVEPAATDHIAEQVQMINELLAKGLAYVAADGSVYYKIAAFPSYGALSRIKERELKATITTADDDHKDDVGDFALWKAHKPAEDGAVKWPGPKGAAAGRPGWHIECSAMSRKHLGDTIDLHAGGVDLLFPHHENEIAQSEGCTGHTFARHWFHSEHLLVNGTTMSKSKGNYYTVGDLLEKSYSPMAIRFALLAGSPRKQLDFTLKSLHDAERNLRSLKSDVEFFCDYTRIPISEFNHWAENPRPYKKLRFAHLPQVSKFLFGDPTATAFSGEGLNFPGALGELFLRLALHRRGPGSAEDATELLHGLSYVFFALGLKIDANTAVVPPEITVLSQKRWAAKQAKDFKTADALRKEIEAAGWRMLDGKDGYKLEPAKK